MPAARSFTLIGGEVWPRPLPVSPAPREEFRPSGLLPDSNFSVRCFHPTEIPVLFVLLSDFMNSVVKRK